MILRLLALGSMLMLSACAASTVPWQNPDVPKEQWSRDWNSCRRWAESQVGFRDEDSSSAFREYDRSRAKKQIEGYANLCMTDRGYLPATKK